MLKELGYQKSPKLKREQLLNQISFHNEFFYVHNLENITKIDLPEPSFEIKTLDPSELIQLRKIWPVNLKHLEKRFKAGNSECFISTVNGTPVAYHWVQFSGTHFIQQANCHYKLNDHHEFIIYHVRVSEKFQLKGISTFAYNHILNTYKEAGYKIAFIYTSSKNIANQKSLAKLGFTKIQTLSSIKIKSKYYPFRRICNKINQWLTLQ